VPWFVIGPACFIATVAVLIVLFRTRWNRTPFLPIAAVACVCLLSGGVIIVQRLAAAPEPGQGTSPADIFYGLVCYVWLLFAFMETYYTLNTSVSLRVVSEIAASRDGSMTLEELKTRYPYDWMISQRLRMLADQDLVRERGGRFSTSPKAIWLCGLFVLVKRILRLGESG
jgi:hypothetical protein